MPYNEDTLQKHTEFQASSNTWMKNSDYEIYVDGATGGIWIKPKASSKLRRYRPFKHTIKGILLKNIIDLGKELQEHYEPYTSGINFTGAVGIHFLKYSDILESKYGKYQEICKIDKKDCNGNYYMYAAEKILKFVKRFGLLGLYTELDPTSLCYNNTYTVTMKYFFPQLPEQFMPRNNIDYEEFWCYYSEPVTLIEQFARHVYFLSQVDTYFNEKKYIVGAKAERLHFPGDPCYLDMEITWGEWFNTIMSVDEITIKPKYNRIAKIKYSNEKEVISYNWQIDWEFTALHKAICLLQVLNLMSEYQFVKTCRCGVTFVPKDIRAEYHNPACRTRLNTRKSRLPKPKKIEEGVD